jgi:AraC-like DNA-binding protein
MPRRSMVAVAAASVALVGAGTSTVHASADRAGIHRVPHVLLLSIDGMHQSDLDCYIANHPHSTLAKLTHTGSEYIKAATVNPSDSDPGGTALMTGGKPEHSWTVAELATRTAVSRSVLDDRFRQVLGRSPIRYLTEWRMHLAQELLTSADLTVYEIARRVGYRSEEAFSRAFKRERGQSPGHWRSARTTTATLG